MTWQDNTITICIIIFSYALIPQIIKNFKHKKSHISPQTSIITSIGMFVLAITYVTLNLFSSAIITIINAGLWEILFIQSKIYN